jgi:hypothetical protein
MAVKECRLCGTVNPSSATTCDCGAELREDPAASPTQNQPVRDRTPAIALLSAFFVLRAVGIPVGTIRESYIALQSPDPISLDELAVSAILGLAVGILSAYTARAVYQQRRASLLLIPILLLFDAIGYIALFTEPSIRAPRVVGSLIGTAIQIWGWAYLSQLSEKGVLKGRRWSVGGLAFWDHTYNRQQLLLASRWLLAFVASIHESMGFGRYFLAETADARDDAVGIMLVGFLYIFVAVLPSLWARALAIGIWLADLMYTNLFMEGVEFQPVALVYVATGSVFLFKLLKYRNAVGPSSIDFVAAPDEEQSSLKQAP